MFKEVVKFGPKEWVILAAAVFLSILFFYAVDTARSIEVVKQLELCACETKVVTVDDVLQPGHGFSLLLGVPHAEHLDHGFQGHMEITGTSGSPINFQFAPNEIVRANWLTPVRQDLVRRLYSRIQPIL